MSNLGVGAEGEERREEKGDLRAPLLRTGVLVLTHRSPLELVKKSGEKERRTSQNHRFSQLLATLAWAQRARSDEKRNASISTPRSSANEITWGGKRELTKIPCYQARRLTELNQRVD